MKYPDGPELPQDGEWESQIGVLNLDDCFQPKATLEHPREGGECECPSSHCTGAKMRYKDAITFLTEYRFNAHEQPFFMAPDYRNQRNRIKV